MIKISVRKKSPWQQSTIPDPVNTRGEYKKDQTKTVPPPVSAMKFPFYNFKNVIYKIRGLDVYKRQPDIHGTRKEPPGDQQAQPNVYLVEKGGKAAKQQHSHREQVQNTETDSLLGDKDQGDGRNGGSYQEQLGSPDEIGVGKLAGNAGNQDKQAGEIAVSYTHLDVYKRQPGN